ncbi:MAG: hypothetical protein F6K40_24035 [Okeania sp. SIO3I5]|nr:hypothetical protein [Okeania sp. SIO3I5]
MAKIWREKDRLGPCLATRETRIFLPESFRLNFGKRVKKRLPGENYQWQRYGEKKIDSDRV